MNSNIISLFPIPVLSILDFINDEERKDIFEKIINTDHQKQEVFLGNGYSTHNHRKHNSFLNDDILDRIEKSIDEYSKIRGTGTQKVFLQSYWSTIQNKGSILKNHTHPNSVFSGSLYINVNEQSSKIYFDNPNLNIMNEALPIENEYNQHLFPIQPENGQLLIFPSWLKHGSDYDVNKMDGRISVSFNTCY